MDALGSRRRTFPDRFGLELHPDKTRIVYCWSSRRRTAWDGPVSFTFCGYTFRPRKAYDKRRKEAFTGFLPAPAPEKLTDMSRRVASWRLTRRTNLTPNDLAAGVNPVLRGWLTYYTTFYASAVIPLCQRIDRRLMRWMWNTVPRPDWPDTLTVRSADGMHRYFRAPAGRAIGSTSGVLGPVSTPADWTAAAAATARGYQLVARVGGLVGSPRTPTRGERRPAPPGQARALTRARWTGAGPAAVICQRRESRDSAVAA